MSLAPVFGHGFSFVGKYREDNQDSFRLCEPDNPDTRQSHGYLYAIADGMGGYSHGGVASTTALDSFFNSFYTGHASQSARNLKQAAQKANQCVVQTAMKMGAVRMGTTLSAVNIFGNQLHLAHVGDSRVYLIRGRKARCLTDDHTQVGELVRMKLLSPDKVRTHDSRSVLNKCLGINLFIQPDVTQHTLEAGDRLILCTDGIWSAVEDDEFALLARDQQSPAMLSEALIQLAMERDSDDNASALVVHIEQIPEVATPQPALKGLSALFARIAGKA